MLSNGVLNLAGQYFITPDDATIATGSPLEIQIEGCKSSNLYKSVRKVKELLKIDGCNLSHPEKPRGAIAHLVPL